MGWIPNQGTGFGEGKAGLQDPKVPAGSRHPRGVWGWAGLGCGLSKPRQVPASLLGTSCIPCAPGIPHPCSGTSPCPSPPEAHHEGEPPPGCPHHWSNTAPQVSRSQRAAPTLSRRLLLLNCANEMTLIKAIAPQLGDGCCRLSGAPQLQPCPSAGQDQGPCSGDAAQEPSPGDTA